MVKSSSITKTFLAALPSRPGVYLMHNSAGKVLYVGKAKNLRARVRSYFSESRDSRYHIDYLVKEVSAVETIVTETERQALILEADLIKRHQPHYNLRLKDDRAHLVARIDQNNPWPRVELVRQTRNDGATYIGPFAFSYEVKAMFEVIKRAIPLRTCSDNMLNNRVRPCIEYQIKRCAAPCCLDVDKKQYLKWVASAIDILHGKNREVIKSLENQIEHLINNLRFEEAAEIRDRLLVLKKSANEQLSNEYSIQAQDVFGIFREGEQVSVSLLMVRNGRLYGAKNFEFEKLALPDSEIMAAVLSQYYQHPNLPAQQIILPILPEDKKVREDYYSELSGTRVQITKPQRGSKARLLSLALTNASEYFKVKFRTDSRDNHALEELRSCLGLEQTPRVIECADISHFQGKDTVASIVCFKDGRKEQSLYRRFILSVDGKPDDFASMLEVLRRHLSRAAEENTLCDLMVIDGGVGQLSQALKVRKELGLQFPVMIALAKKRVEKDETSKFSERMSKDVLKKPERIFVEDQTEAVVLEPGSDALRLLENLRNEAHRFAITFHRERRSKRIFKSGLDQIPGIGSERKKRLLRNFSSVAAISEASPEEIASVAKIPVSLAKRLSYLLKKQEN